MCADAGLQRRTALAAGGRSVLPADLLPPRGAVVAPGGLVRLDGANLWAARVRGCSRGGLRLPAGSDRLPDVAGPLASPTPAPCRGPVTGHRRARCGARRGCPLPQRAMARASTAVLLPEWSAVEQPSVSLPRALSGELHGPVRSRRQDRPSPTSAGRGDVQALRASRSATTTCAVSTVATLAQAAAAAVRRATTGWPSPAGGGREWCGRGRVAAVTRGARSDLSGPGREEDVHCDRHRAGAGGHTITERSPATAAPTATARCAPTGSRSAAPRVRGQAARGRRRSGCCGRGQVGSVL